MAFILGARGLSMVHFRPQAAFLRPIRTCRTFSSTSPPPSLPPPPPSSLPPFPSTSHAYPAIPSLSEEDALSYQAHLGSLTVSEKAELQSSLEADAASIQSRLSLVTGENSTMRGRFKALSRDYGFPFVVYWWSVWGVTGVLCYAGITVFEVPVQSYIAQVDDYMGWDLAARVDPQLGEVAAALAVNEMLEPLRLPIVVATTKRVVDGLGYGPKR